MTGRSTGRSSAMHAPRTRWSGPVIAVGCVLLVACGARLTPQQKAAGIAVVDAGRRGPLAAAPNAPSLPGQPVAAAPAPASGNGPATGAATALATVPQPSGGAGDLAPTAGPLAATDAPRSGQPSAPGSVAVTSTASQGGCAPGALGSSDVGVTPSQVTITNVSDVTGPIPGIFKATQDAVKAFVAYFNGTNQTICGRTLKLISLDGQTSQNGDHDGAVAACASSLAMVGSESGFDQGGAPVVKQCGIPDMRATVDTAERFADPTVYGTEAASQRYQNTSVPDYFHGALGDAVTQHAAYLYINIGAVQEQVAKVEAGFSQRGFAYVDTQAIDIADFNYTPYVTKMKDAGVRFVQFTGAYQEAVRLAQAMQQAHFTPAAFLLDQTAYTPEYAQSGGSSVDGTYTYLDTPLFSEAAGNPELQLYLTWLNRVAPGAAPTWFGLYAWSAARLFTELAIKVGPNLTRQALLAQLATVHAWTANGLHGPQDIGGRKTGPCWMIAQLKGSTWSRASPPGAGKYSCGQILVV